MNGIILIIILNLCFTSIAQPQVKYQKYKVSGDIEKILFAGCMVKDLSSKALGNTADGDLNKYPDTIRKVLYKYRNAKLVIPGHGRFD